MSERAVLAADEPGRFTNRPYEFDPDIHHRRSIRLRGYDYSQAGAYFITICTQDKLCLLGNVVERQMQLNEYGHVAAVCWQCLGCQYAHVDLDAWVLMPNHLHGIILMTQPAADAQGGLLIRGGSGTGGGSRTAPTRKPLGRLVGAFKTVSTKQINEIRNRPGASLWQRNYYERIIRNEDELNKIREYILTNPLRWATDRDNPAAVETSADSEPWYV